MSDQRLRRRSLALTSLIVLAATGVGIGAVAAISRAGPDDVATPRAHAAQSLATRVVNMPVDGMACISCAASIKQKLKSVEGVSDVEIIFAQRLFRITYFASRPDVPRRAAAAINSLGYKAGAPVQVQ